MFFTSSGRSPGTIRPLEKFFAFFFHHQAGRLEQLDHLRNSSHSFSPIQVTHYNETPSEKSLYFFHGQVTPPYSPPEQVTHYNETILKNQKKKTKRKDFDIYFSLQNLLYKVKRKSIFQCLCTVSIVKNGQLL